MNKFLTGYIAFAIALVVFAVAPSFATEADLTQKQVRDPRALATILDTRTIVQTDTNATTVTTAYTPSRAGQLLIGSAGSGTNAVWVAKGTTTNDWVQVAP